MSHLWQVGCQKQSGGGPDPHDVPPLSAPPCLAPTAIKSTLSLLNDSESSQLFAASRKPLSNCIRCAVVGNGGILNGSRQGQNIDAHDYVFRCVGQEPGVWRETSWRGGLAPGGAPGQHRPREVVTDKRPDKGICIDRL